MSAPSSLPNPASAVICPGQGSQRPGGVALLPPEARAHFDRASVVVGEDLWDLGLQGTEERLAQPSLLQPYLVAWACADWERGRAEHPGLSAPDVVLGHSSGENAAMVLSGAVAFEAAVRFAHARGRLMDAACACAGEGRSSAGTTISATTSARTAISGTSGILFMSALLRSRPVRPGA